MNLRLKKKPENNEYDFSKKNLKIMNLLLINCPILGVSEPKKLEIFLLAPPALATYLLFFLGGFAPKNDAVLRPCD